MNHSKKEVTMKKQYEAPEVQVMEMEVESSILQASKTGYGDETNLP